MKDLFPIAEMFDSVQGEGYHLGQRMYFVRLAGCPVGEYLSPAELKTESFASDFDQLPLLRESHLNHSVCTSVFGQRFLCDTNYKIQEGRLSLDEIFERIRREAPGCQTLCLTGGEPLAHPAGEFISAAIREGYGVHIETSGSILIPDDVASRAWVVCSPKAGFVRANMERIHELKFVIGPHLGTPASVAQMIINFLQESEEETLEQMTDRIGFPISLQPIGYVERGSRESSDFCLDVLRALPQSLDVYLRPQTHKSLGLR